MPVLMTVVLVMLKVGVGYAAVSAALALLMALIHGLPVKQRVRTTPADLSPRARELDVVTPDGLLLKAYYAPPEGDRPLILFQAGRRASRDHMLPWAAILAGAGYGIFTFDWRAQGESEGRVLSYGAHGPKDLAGVFAVLAGLPELEGRPIGIYACSLGAACVAMSAADLPDEVRCMILDSPYGDLQRMTLDRLRFLGPLGILPGLFLAGLARVLIGMTPREIVPERALAAFAPRPLMVFHGDADTVIPVEEGRRVHATYPGPKDYWESEGDDHVDARTNRSREWMGKVAGFFDAHLPETPGVAEVLALTPERVTEPFQE